MKFDQFCRYARTEQIVADYLDDVTQPLSGATHRAAGLDLLFGVAAYALFRLVKNYFDHQRGLQMAELRRLMEAEVDKLVQQGWKPDHALKATLAISEAVLKLPADAPVIAAGLAILRGAK